jgi:hypothetical protein
VLEITYKVLLGIVSPRRGVFLPQGAQRLRRGRKGFASFAKPLRKVAGGCGSSPQDPCALFAKDAKPLRPLELSRNNLTFYRRVAVSHRKGRKGFAKDAKPFRPLRSPCALCGKKTPLCGEKTVNLSRNTYLAPLALQKHRNAVKKTRKLFPHNSQ